TYDTFGRPSTITDALDRVRAYTYYDSLMKVDEVYTRTAWPTDGTPVPGGCEQSGANEAVPAGRIRCTTQTFYDGLDQQIAVVDGGGQKTFFYYDAGGRQIAQATTRSPELPLNWTTATYNRDGNPIWICSPRQVTEGGTAAGPNCPVNPTFGEWRTYTP